MLTMLIMIMMRHDGDDDACLQAVSSVFGGDDGENDHDEA